MVLVTAAVSQTGAKREMPVSTQVRQKLLRCWEGIPLALELL